MGRYELQPDESVVKETVARQIRGKMRVTTGQFILTNRRFLFRENPLVPLFGVLGLLFNGRLGKFTIDIPLSSITALRRGKFGLNKNVLEISTAPGDQRRIVIDKFEAWIPILIETIGQVEGVRIELHS